MKAFSSPLAIARFALTLAVATPLMLPAATAQPEAALEARLDARFDELAQAGFTGFAAIARDGEIIFARGAGFADPATRRPFTLDTQVDILSITKSFTGMAIASLVDAGRLSPDATLADFFPDVPGDKAAITVQQLLTHTAGLPDAVGDDFSDEGWDSVREKGFAAELLHAPGSAYRYSNLGFSFLAAIIESVTGRTYEDYLVNDLLVPAGIEQTGYLSVYDDALAARSSRGEPVIDASWGGHAPNWNLIGNGGLVSTPRDMIAWEHAYQNATIVSPAARDLAHAPLVREGEGAPSFYGYGLVVEDDPQFGRIYWHNGGNRSFNSHWRVLADQGYQLFATTNQRSVSADRAIEALVAALMDQEFEVQRPRQVLADPAALPDTAGGRAAAEFLAMIASDDEAVWRDYVLNRMSDDMRAVAPMEGHLEMMRQVHQDFGDAALVAVLESQDMIELHLRDPQTGETIPVVIEYAADGSVTGLLLG
ncbi:serine hydrolase domain-containing protein [uncultured Maricaulis sp.]|uniref:serine hydrolase domain-containing protein n=1 Tax=uncultured Maricaulis sp. TaxID=174710 RepID=UPI0030DB7E75|tara:strand:- start:71 stop:1513 length:1443 start_codon:yes stop_codon:yes gene_type:complete